MADIQFHFFGPGLMWSIIFSIVLSIVLTVGLNLWGRRMMKRPEEMEYEYEKENEREESGGFEEPQAKSSGMILIGPIPINFGSGGIRFDKKMFKYALLFFLIVLFMYFIFMKTIRL
jgi:Protein of unknown function DUF131.